MTESRVIPLGETRCLRSSEESRDKRVEPRETRQVNHFKLMPEACTDGPMKGYIGLERISFAAQKDSKVRFMNLMHHLNEFNLTQAFRQLDGSKAVGIDQVTKHEYGSQLQANIEGLYQEIRGGGWRPRPSREKLIPKPQGGMRRLAIGCLENKIVQGLCAKILDAIYGPIFHRHSFGYRSGKSPHQAIAHVHQEIRRREENCVVVEMDIEKFFDTIPHEKLMELIGQRIGDAHFLRLGAAARKGYCFLMNKTVTRFIAVTLGMALLNSTPQASWAGAEVKLTGKIFEAESAKQSLLFTFRGEADIKPGLKVLTTTYTSSEGKVAAIETTEFAIDASGQERVSSFRLNQKQLGAEGSIEIKNGRATFTYTRDGRSKTKAMDAGDDFVVGPGVFNFLRGHWTEILAGKKLKVRFAVLERLETIGFEFSKDKDVRLNGKPAVVVKMKPSSLLVSALVDPIRFYISADATHLLEIHGRSTLKRELNGGLKDFNAVTVFEVPQLGGTR